MDDKTRKSAQIVYDRLIAGEVMLTALKRIRYARDYCAKHGHHPANMLDGAEFDDWAADIADTVITQAEAAGIKPR